MASSQQYDIYLDSDMTIEVANLRNKLTGSLVTGATVEADVLDEDGNDVTGAGNPIALAEVSGYEGLYRGSIPDTADLSLADGGTIVITADDGAGVNRKWTLEYVVRTVQ